MGALLLVTTGGVEKHLFTLSVPGRLNSLKQVSIFLFVGSTRFKLPYAVSVSFLSFQRRLIQPFSHFSFLPFKVEFEGLSGFLIKMGRSKNLNFYIFFWDEKLGVHLSSEEASRSSTIFAITSGNTWGGDTKGHYPRINL